METESNEPQTQLGQSLTLVEIEDSPALATCLEDSFFETRRLRKDGWDGAKMAVFFGTLAETGVVTLACRACGMSAQSAYALRHRDPLVANVWDAALSMARVRLADELLARSLKGSAEAILREGCIVAERQHFDNKLAFSILRRLDRQAELGATFRTPPAWEIPAPPPAVSGEWQALLDALSEDRTADAARLLTPPAAKVDSEVDDPPVEGSEGDNFVRRRVWQKWETDEWRTDFPPPPGFAGHQQGDWEEQGYWRQVSEDELAALVAAGIAEPDAGAEITIDQDESDRDAFFSGLVKHGRGDD